MLEVGPWFFNYKLQCGAILTFEAMTGSFRFWMEALRMRGSLLVLHGVAGTTMFVCGPWDPSWRDGTWFQLCIGFVVRYFITGFATMGLTISKGGVNRWYLPYERYE